MLKKKTKKQIPVPTVNTHFLAYNFSVSVRQKTVISKLFRKKKKKKKKFNSTYSIISL